MARAEAEVASRPNGDSTPSARFGLADRAALRDIFGSLCLFAVYLFVIQIIAGLLNSEKLTGALAQLLPYCLLMAGVFYRGRQLAGRDKQTVLIAVCFACVFVVLLFNVTKEVPLLAGVPVFGRDSIARNRLASLAMVTALASFPAASYFLLKEILLAKQQLDEKVDRLEDALSHVRRLQGLLPICMWCHKIRTDQQCWQQIEDYVSEHSEATFTHSVCPECAEQHYGLKARAQEDAAASSGQ